LSCHGCARQPCATPDFDKLSGSPVGQVDAGFQLGLNDVTQWDEADVEAWLRIVDLQDLTEVFLENGIVGEGHPGLAPASLSVCLSSACLFVCLPTCPPAARQPV